MTKHDNAARRLSHDQEPSPVYEPAAHARLLDDVAGASGFDYFLMAFFPQGDSTGFADNRLFSNWPQELADHYEQCDAFHSSRLVSALRRTNMPVFCNGGGFAASANDEDGKGLVARFAGHGLHRTFAFSLHDAALRHYIFAFSGDRPALSGRESMELVYGSMQILEGFFRQNRNDNDTPSERLSRREIECLRWSAAGKSSEEIAIILNLSSHTVASYLKSAMRKLDSVNRMQAIARALRYRLL